MSNMSNMNREQKKRQLRRQMIEAGNPGKRPANPFRGEKEQEIAREAEHKSRIRRIKRLFLFLAAGCAVFFFGYEYTQNHHYTSYTTIWEKQIPASDSGFTAYENFGSNVLKYTKDGASYIDRSGNVVWSLSYQLKTPICYVNGDYAVIADQQGNTIYICDKTGCQGEAVTLLPILRVSVSAYGVAAALVEDQKASYVTFFKKDGSTLDWGIKTVMSGNGYLMDLSLSPEGTQVMLSDLYLHEGMLKNRIVFYNFSEYGKSYPDRLVGGFEEFSDRLCPRVRIMDENHAFAAADGKLGFFSLENVTSPELTAEITINERMRSIACSDRYAAVVVDNPEGENSYRLDVYRSDGKQMSSTPFSFQYKTMDIDGDLVILYNENSCAVYTVSGVERFTETFDFTISKAAKGSRFQSLILTGGDTMREIRLK